MLYFPRLYLIGKYSRRGSLLQALKWMAITGTVTALASPVLKKEMIPLLEPGRDMVLVIDSSRSMDEEFSITTRENKFETLKKILKEFIERRDGDRIGLIVFGEFAYVASPVTFDHEMVAKMVPYLEVAMAGERTAIYDALAMAAKLLKRSDAKTKVAVMLTDGKNTAGKIPLHIAKKLLKEYGIKLYTIGVGRPGDYDPDLLKELAKENGGRFFSASDPKMLKKVYDAIDELEPSMIELKPVAKMEYLFSYPLFIAAMSLLAYLFFVNRSEA
ncbi:MAG: VWA domain-containing protein [Hydrogenimonas sp.]|nr:VWA domain-containing protein [Hydrogenimonas sp.]